MTDAARWHRVDVLLYREWDPIGVRDRAPEDEYRSYVGGVLALLDEGADVDRIAAHLGRLRTAAMGLPPNEARDRRAADLLRAIR